MSESGLKNNNLNSDEIRLKDLIVNFNEWFLYFKSKWKFILVFCLLGGLIGFFYAFSKKTLYVASITFALEDEKSNGGGLSGAMGLASSLGFDLGTNAGGAFSGGNLIELMKSRTIIEKVLLDKIVVNDSSYSLAEYFLLFSGLRDIMSKDSELRSIHFKEYEKRIGYSKTKDSILGEIYENFIGKNALLSVTQKDKKIGIISVDCKSIDENFSKTLAESIVKEVSEFYIYTKSKKARTNVAILQKQTDSIRNELNNAISGVAQATDNTFNLNSALNIKRAASTSRQVDVQANTAILTQLVGNLEMAKVTLLKETPLIQVIDKPILPLKKEKISKVKSLILGSILATLIVVLFLTIRRTFKKALN